MGKERRFAEGQVGCGVRDPAPVVDIDVTEKVVRQNGNVSETIRIEVTNR